MSQPAHTLEDHRFATTYEVQSRSREELAFLPHVPGPDLQVLCEEIAGHVLSKTLGPIQILVFAPGGTLLVLARYLASFAKPIRLLAGVEDGYSAPQVLSELRRFSHVDVVTSLPDYRGHTDTSCIVLAPVRNLLSWMQVTQRMERASDCRVLAYDPDLVLRHLTDTGAYAYAVSRIWCGR